MVFIWQTGGTATARVKGQIPKATTSASYVWKNGAEKLLLRETTCDPILF